MSEIKQCTSLCVRGLSSFIMVVNGERLFLHQPTTTNESLCHQRTGCHGAECGHDCGAPSTAYCLSLAPIHLSIRLLFIYYSLAVCSLFNRSRFSPGLIPVMISFSWSLVSGWCLGTGDPKGVINSANNSRQATREQPLLCSPSCQAHP